MNQTVTVLMARVNLLLRGAAIAASVCTFVTSSIFAQGTTSAAINGIVRDQNGQPLVGANVVAVHVPSGTTYGTTTRDDGRYNLFGLRVGGPYTVSCSFIGYKKETQTDIDLVLSQNLTIDFKLVEEAVQITGVLITAEKNAILSSARTGAAATVRGENFDRLATISRSFQDFQKISPLFVGSSAAGRQNRFNNIQIDGAMYNDLFGLAASGTPGGQAGTNPISLDALQEFQVVIAPYDVRLGGFTGGGINAITRSGGNKYTGSAYYYGRNENFVGTSPDTLRRKFAQFSEYQMGFRLGGPIVETKLFFFVNGEITRRKQPLDRTLGSSISAPSNNQYKVPADTVNRIISILNNYGYSPGSFTHILFERPSTKIFGRLDFNLSDRHRLTLRHNYVDASDNVSPSLGQLYAENSLYKFASTTNSTVLQLTSTFSNAMANELILGYTRIRDHRTFPGTNFPIVLIRRAGFNGDADMVAGSENFSTQNALDQDIFELTENFTYFLREHTLTFGTSNQLFKFSNLFIRDTYGNYEFLTLNDFLNGYPSRYQYSYVLPGGNQRAEWKGIQYGFYAQDEWTGVPKLKVTLGIRIDIPTFPDKPRFNPSVDTLFGAQGLGTNIVSSGKPLWSPRLGFNWDPVGDRSVQLRGGAGVFSGRIGYVWLSNQYGNTGVDFGRIDQSFNPATKSFTFQPDPNKQVSSIAGVKTTEIDLTDKDFKMPQVFRADLALDRELPMGFVATIEGLYTKSINDIVYQDINLAGPQSNGGLTPGGHLVGDARPVYGVYSTSSRTFTAKKLSDQLAASVQRFTNVILMKNTSEGNQYYLTLQLVRPLAPDGWSTNFSYTYGQSKDLNSVLSSQAISQWRFNETQGDPNNPTLSYSNFDLRHRIFAALSRRFEFAKGFGTTIGLAYEGRSGSPFSYIYNGDVNGDGQVSNDLVYIPKDRNDVILMLGSGATATVLPYTDATYDKLDQFIQNDAYLSAHRGQIAERQGARTPWNHFLDLSLVQEIPTFQSHKIEIVVSVLNFLNLLNRDWGYVKSISFQTFQLLTFHSLDASTTSPTYGKPRFVLPSNVDPKVPPWSNSDLSSRWQAQLGVRYEF